MYREALQKVNKLANINISNYVNYILFLLFFQNCLQLSVKICLSLPPSLTSRAAETFPLLSPFGVTQDVDDERGKLTSVETGQLLTALREEHVRS